MTSSVAPRTPIGRNPAQRVAAASNADFVAAWRHRYGLDLPLWERYFVFLHGLLHGDLGISIASHRPVLDDIAELAPATLEPATISFLLSLLVGLPLGILAAVKRDSWVDHLARLVSLLGVSAPTFWLAFIFLVVFDGKLQIAPGPGRLNPISLPPADGTGFYLTDTLPAGDWDGFRDVCAHLVLPWIVLAAATVGPITRTTRASMLEISARTTCTWAAPWVCAKPAQVHLRPHAAAVIQT